MSVPDFSLELKHIANGYCVCGIDEAGRGPWAGPVVAAAVILDPAHVPSGINDSKKLTEAEREELFDPIVKFARVSVGIVEAHRIDELNILQATFLAMQDALRSLSPSPSMALIDGNRSPKIDCAVDLVVGGDARSLSIAAASIVAKVTRDRIMRDLDLLYPQYGFAKHKGYGTAQHMKALRAFGPCTEHRKSFKPIKTLLTALTIEPVLDSQRLHEDS
jgi:ribonuclease HII